MFPRQPKPSEYVDPSAGTRTDIADARYQVWRWYSFRSSWLYVVIWPISLVSWTAWVTAFVVSVAIGVGISVGLRRAFLELMQAREHDFVTYMCAIYPNFHGFGNS